MKWGVSRYHLQFSESKLGRRSFLHSLTIIFFTSQEVYFEFTTTTTISWFSLLKIIIFWVPLLPHPLNLNQISIGIMMNCQFESDLHLFEWGLLLLWQATFKWFQSRVLSFIGTLQKKSLFFPCQLKCMCNFHMGPPMSLSHHLAPC